MMNGMDKNMPLLWIMMMMMMVIMTTETLRMIMLLLLLLLLMMIETTRTIILITLRVKRLIMTMILKYANQQQNVICAFHDDAGYDNDHDIDDEDDFSW